MFKLVYLFLPMFTRVCLFTLCLHMFTYVYPGILYVFLPMFTCFYLYLHKFARVYPFILVYECLPVFTYVFL